jgi:hypothetical protein
VNEFLLLIILSAVVYRVARFIVLDTIWEGWRDKLLDWLTTGTDAMGSQRVLDKKRDPEEWAQLPYIKRKFSELMMCPFCVTIWVAGFTVLAYDVVIDPNLPLPVFYWLTIATGGLVFWAVIDSE